MRMITRFKHGRKTANDKTNLIIGSMHSSFQLAKKYLRYYLTASNGKGHSIHSPFVFDFVAHVLPNNEKHNCFEEIEKLRNLTYPNIMIN